MVNLAEPDVVFKGFLCGIVAVDVAGGIVAILLFVYESLNRKTIGKWGIFVGPS